jgi:membrane fusion protein, heavy metal efflux system
MSATKHQAGYSLATTLRQLFCASLLLGNTHLATAAESAGKSSAAAATISESQLNQVTISAESAKKLGITTSKVTLASRQPYKSYPADVSLSPASLAAYSTPFNGQVTLAQGLQIGSRVKAGQLLFTITPVVAPETRLNLLTSLADAEGQLQAAEKQLSAYQLTLNRSTQLQSQRVGSQKAVDDARANVAIAETSLRTAQQKRDLLKQAIEHGSTGNYSVTATSAGVVNNIYFAQGQLLASGAKLVDITNQDTLWITVLVPHEQISTLNLATDAWLPQQMGTAYTLKPVMTQPEGDLLTGTRKLVYALQAKGEIAPMQRLTVQLPLRQAAQPRMSVPCSATVVDIYGNTWVYLQQDTAQFSRQPVFVTQSIAHDCVLSDQRLAGKTVVTQGAQELFAIETGYTH